jgi:hypothetical protein
LAKRYVIDKGKISFPSKLAKEHWILSSNIQLLTDVLTLGEKNTPNNQKALIKEAVRSLTKMKRRMEKELILLGYKIN